MEHFPGLITLWVWLCPKKKKGIFLYRSRHQISRNLDWPSKLLNGKKYEKGKREKEKAECKVKG
jgi:hypothetical protein